MYSSGDKGRPLARSAALSQNTCLRSEQLWVELTAELQQSRWEVCTQEEGSGSSDLPGVLGGIAEYVGFMLFRFGWAL